MIPFLYAADETAFDSNGIGPIKDATSCVVTEELNGAFTLKLTVPRTTKRLADLAVGKQILAKPNPYDPAQPFRIERVSKSLKGELEIYAPHLCYDLAHYPVGSGNYTATTLALAASYIQNNRLETRFPQFYFQDDIGSARLGDMVIQGPVAAWDLLGSDDEENTLLGTYDVELKFDNRTVHLVAERGSDRGFVIAFGRNMTELSYEEDGAELYTAVLSYWRKDTDYRIGDVVLATSEGYPNLHFSRVFLNDKSSDYSTKPTASTLNADSSAYIRSHPMSAPEIHIKASAVPPGSRGLKTLEELQLGDTVTIRAADLSVERTARVVQTTFDVLRGRYSSVEVDSRFAGVATTIAKIAKRVKPV